MPYTCIVPGCTNSSRLSKSCPVKFAGSFHTLPQNEKRLKLWQSRIGIKTATRFHAVCSDHFLDEDFVISRARAERLGYELKHVRLTNTAVPSVKLKPNEGPTKPAKERKSLAAIKRMNLETIRLYDEKARLEKAALEENERIEQAAKEEQERLENERLKTAALAAYDPAMAYAGWEATGDSEFLTESEKSAQGGKKKKKVRRSPANGRHLTPADCADEQTSGLRDYNERRHEYLRHILHRPPQPHAAPSWWQEDPLVVKPDSTDPDYEAYSSPLLPGLADQYHPGQEYIGNDVSAEEIDVKPQLLSSEPITIEPAGPTPSELPNRPSTDTSCILQELAGPVRPVMLHKVIRTATLSHPRSLLLKTDSTSTAIAPKETDNKAVVNTKLSSGNLTTEMNLTLENSSTGNKKLLNIKYIKSEPKETVISDLSDSNSSATKEIVIDQRFDNGDSHVKDSDRCNPTQLTNGSPEVRNVETAANGLHESPKSDEILSVERPEPGQADQETTDSLLINKTRPYQETVEPKKYQEGNGSQSHKYTSGPEKIDDRKSSMSMSNQNSFISEQQGTLSMLVEDEEAKPRTHANIPIYLSEIPLNNKKAGRKRKVVPLDINDIEQVLFPGHHQGKVQPTKKKKKAGRPAKKAEKQEVGEINEPHAEVQEKEESMEEKADETQPEKAELYPDPDFDYETFFDTDSEEEQELAAKQKKTKGKNNQSDDSDWEPGAGKKNAGSDEDEWSESGEDEYVDSDEEAEEELYECDQCDATFNDCWASLCAHRLKEHPAQDTSKCDICDQSRHDEKDLHEHLKEVHSINGFTERKLGHYFCKNCNEIHAHALSYIFHREDKHESCLLCCKQCKFVADHRFQMKTHMKNAHDKTDFSEYTQDFTLTKTKTRRKHVSKSTYHNSCFLCGESMKRKYLFKHKQEKHPEAFRTKVFECIVCSKVASSHRSMATHYERHFLSRKCPMCPQRFITQDLRYRSHIERCHCGVRYQYCAECNLILSAKTALNIHIKKVHQNMRDLLCSTCGRGFKNAYSLGLHNLIHTGEKPIKCELCDYRCRQKTALDWHMTRKHPAVALPVNEKYKELPGRPRRKATTKKNSNVKQPKPLKA